VSQRLYQRKDSPNYWVSIRGPHSEAFRAEAGDINLARGVVYVRGQVARLITKGQVTEQEIAERFPKVTPNDLRRTHATWLRAAGIETSLLGRQLRHKDGRMAERLYGRLAPDDLVSVLEERLAPRQKGPPRRLKRRLKRGR
jgi:hypothetical protein